MRSGARQEPLSIKLIVDNWNAVRSCCGWKFRKVTVAGSPDPRAAIRAELVNVLINSARVKHWTNAAFRGYHLA